MAFDPSGQISISESPEALEIQRAQEAQDAILDAKYSDPSVLEWEQEQLRQAIYKVESIPLTEQQKEANREQFESLYRADLELIFNTQAADIIGEGFASSWDIESSVYILLGKIGTPEENKEAIADSIAEYINPRITSIRLQDRLQSWEWITVQAWMNAWYINAFLWSNRHVDMTPEANNLNIWDTLKFWDDATTLLRNDTAIWELSEDNGDINEIAGREFNESRYAPLIKAHIPETWQITDPLHDISPEQVEEISNWYLNWVDIVHAMSNILWSDHEVVWLAKDLDNPDSINSRRQQMYSDLWVPPEEQIDPENPSSWDTFVNLVSENYIQILDTDGNVDKEASFILASQTACNKIVEGKHTFTKTLEFEQAYERIHSGENNHLQMKEDLLTVFRAVNSSEWVRGRKNQTDLMRMQNNARQKSLFLAWEFHRIQNLLLQTQNDTPRDLQREEERWEEIETHNSWDIFAAWDLDVWQTWSESWEEVA